MFDPDSRHAKLPLKERTDAAGNAIRIVARRIIPDDRTPLAEVRVQSGDRLDLIAHRAYGDARLFWRIADANPVPDHETLDDEAGRLLKLNQIETG